MNAPLRPRDAALLSGAALAINAYRDAIAAGPSADWKMVAGAMFAALMNAKRQDAPIIPVDLGAMFAAPAPIAAPTPALPPPPPAGNNAPRASAHGPRKAARAAPPRTDGYISIADYKLTGKGLDVPPTMVVWFADGICRRMSFWCAPGHPFNTARGLRACVSSYRTRARQVWIDREFNALCERDLAEWESDSDPLHREVMKRATFDRAAVPEIVSVSVQDQEGTVLARISAAEANEYTRAMRAGAGDYSILQHR
jgi:hypothetical protein